MSDMLTCSVCQEVTYSVVDFLHHKTQHAAPGTAIQCEFCNLSYTRYITLKEHYQSKHKIFFSSLDTSKNKSTARVRQYKCRKKADLSQVAVEDHPTISHDQSAGDGFCLRKDKDLQTNVIGGPSQQISCISQVMQKDFSLDSEQAGVAIASSDSQFMSSQNGNNLISAKSSDTQCNTHLINSGTETNFVSSAISCDLSQPGVDVDEAQLVQGPNNPSDPEDFLFSDQTLLSKPTTAVHVVMERSNPENMIASGLCSLMNTSELHDTTKDHNVPQNQNYGDFQVNSGSVLPYGIQQAENMCSLDSMESDTSAVHVVVEKSNPANSLDNHHLVNNRDLMSIGGNADLIQENMNNSQANMDQESTAAVTVGESKSTPEDFHFILLTDVVEGNSLTYGKQAFRCLHCDYQTCWKSSLCRHMREDHPETLSLHKAIQIKTAHTDSSRTVMKMSEYTTLQTIWKNKASRPRTRGLEKQDLPGNFTCSKCHKTFNRLRYLRKHQAVHRTDQRFLCDECGKAFKTRAYLNQHRRVHKKDAFHCNQCEFTSTINTAIHEHRQIHNKGCVLCDICGTAYFDKSTLVKHKSVHDMSRPYPCTYPGCTWRFMNEVMCRAHVRKHTTKGKFKCNVCGYAFRHKHHLQRHEEKMHGITIPKPWSKKDAVEEKEMDTVEEITDTVNLIVDPDINSDHLNLQNALQGNQLVIATDSEGNTINYEVTDIAMNVAYQTLLAGTEGQAVDTHTILIPQSADCSHIVLQQDTESMTETVQ